MISKKQIRIFIVSSLCLISGACSSLPNSKLSSAERDFLIEVFKEPVVKPQLDEKHLAPVAPFVRSYRKGVVFIVSRDAPSTLGYLGQIWDSSKEAAVEFPNLWKVLGIPTSLAFGGALEFFRYGMGSGFVVGVQGRSMFVLTNAHVVQKSPTSVRLRTVGGKVLEGGLFEGQEAELIWKDAELDVALLKIQLTEPVPQDWALPLGTVTAKHLGQHCFTMGYPDRGEDIFEASPQYPTATLGLVSSLKARPRGTPRVLDGFLQTDAAINPGNSGGPLFDMTGSVIGINKGIWAGPLTSNIGFVIPINDVREAILKELRSQSPS